jgi:hypothetical protein
MNNLLNNLISFAIDNLLFEGEVALFAFICLLFVGNIKWTYNNLNTWHQRPDEDKKVGKTLFIFIINLNLFFFLGQLAIHLYSLIF